MVRRTQTKISALVVAVCCLALSFTDGVGVSSGCGIPERLCYHFFHANIFHALCNVWCLLSIVFTFSVPLWLFLAAFGIAILIPPFLLSATPTMGLSGVCFALLGMMMWQVRRKVYYTSWALAFIVVGFLFPQVNALMHLYCYVAGQMVGFLNAPVPWK